MIRLGGLVSQKAFGKFEMGKVISNPFATAFIKESEGEDHEVSMAQNQLDSIIKAATELKEKMGEEEKQIPAWIQDHITNSENYISQAASNYHEYGDSNEVKFDEIRVLSKKEFQNEAFEVHYSDGIRASKKFGNERQAVQFAKDLIKNKKRLQFVDVFNAGSGFNSTADTKAIVAWWGNGSYTANKAKSDSNLAKKKIDEALCEACWDGYKQVGMKNKGGKQVPNCVPNESVVNEAPNTGERIQNLNNRIKVLRDKISATKSPEQKKLFSDRLKNALQSLSNIKKDHSIKAPHRESIANEISSRTPKIFVKTAAVEKKIKELMDDRKKAVVPYNSEKDPKKKEILKQILIKLTKQIQGYEKNLVQLRDMEEEYLQQMHADAELDTSGL